MNDLEARNASLSEVGLPATQQPRPNRHLSREHLDTVMAYGRLFAASGSFEDAKDEAQAATKVLFGLSIGVEPIDSMTAIWSIPIRKKQANGQWKETGVRLEPSAGLRNALMRRSGRYWTELLHLDATRCEIEFFGLSPVTGKWKSLSIESYTIEQAKRANLADKDTWKQHPEDLLFATVMRKGSKRHAGDLFVGNSKQFEDDADDAAIVTRFVEVASMEAAAPQAVTKALDPGEKDPTIETRKRRVHVLAKELGWDEGVRHLETAKLFQGRQSLNDLKLEELDALIASMVARKDALAAFAEPRSPLVPGTVEDSFLNPPLATAQDNPLADVHMGPELSAYEKIERDIVIPALNPPSMPVFPRGDAPGITAAQTKRILEVATAAGLTDLEMMTICTLWSGGVALQDLTTDDVNRFGAEVKRAAGA